MPTLTYIDTHAHLYAEEFEADRTQVIDKARENGISHILLPNIDMSSIEPLKSLMAQYPGYCLGMMGLHPCSVNADFESELQIIEKELKEGSYLAVGEIGLDYHWDTTYKEQQKEAFSRQLEWAKALGLPVAIHTRSSFDDAISIVEQVQDGNLKGVFHCFGGTVEEGRRIIDTGFYLGIGGVATFKKSNHPEVLPELGIERIILETDAPYLSPVPYRGKRNESAYIPNIAEKLATIYESPLSSIATITSTNACSLFGI